MVGQHLAGKAFGEKESLHYPETTLNATFRLEASARRRIVITTITSGG